MTAPESDSAQAPAAQQMPNLYNLQFAAPQVDAIYAALMKEPYGAVAATVESLRAQVAMQNQARAQQAETAK